MDIKFNNSVDLNAFVKIDDGNVSFKVLGIRNNVIKLKSMQSAIVKSNKGINFPGVILKVPSITPKDQEDIKLGIKLDIDWFALSFVRSSNDIKLFKEILVGKKKNIPIIAKIEKPEAIQNLAGIIEEFDGILIARGDLGVEMPLSQLPVLQKNIIRQCRDAKKPIIIATQILESMISKNTPTRAEVNDVANAVYEEVDAVMLSGETAIGEFPVETVMIMSDIIKNVEQEILSINKETDVIESLNDNRLAIGKAVRTISRQLQIDAIVVMTESGSTAHMVSHYRSKVKIFGLSSHNKVCNKMTLLWGIVPIKTGEFLSTDDMLVSAEKILLDKKYIKKGETFILTAGVPVGVSGSTNMIQIQKTQ